MTRKSYVILFLCPAVLALILFARVGHPILSFENKNSELDYVENKNLNFEELKSYFQNLAERKGARHAFEILNTASLPPNTDLHLLGHIVGDVLYKQEGIRGMEVCTNDFRNACSHSIVVGIFFDKGESALSEIAETCRRAPGGSGAYTMCFHGLGHGILAAVDYDMGRAAELCNKNGPREAVECIGGTVMEIVGGGDHDKNLWTEKRSEYLKPSSPLSLCSSLFIPVASRFMCYIYITPFLFGEAVGGDLGNPLAENFAGSFKFCNQLPTSDHQNRDACYGGFGKEFVGLVQSRDIRKENFNQISDDKLAQIYDWCKLADNKEGSSACIIHAMNALYWGGENPYRSSIHFCDLMDDNEYYQRSCFMGLISSVSTYKGGDRNYLISFCKELPRYKQECINSNNLN